MGIPIIGLFNLRLQTRLASVDGDLETDAIGIDGEVGTVTRHGKWGDDPDGDPEGGIHRGGCTGGH